MTIAAHVITGCAMAKALRRLSILVMIPVLFVSHIMLDSICLWHPQRLMFGGGLWLGILFWLFNFVTLGLVWRFAWRQVWAGLIAWLSLDFEWIVRLFTGHDLGLHARLNNWLFSDDPVGALVEILLTAALLIYLWRTYQHEQKLKAVRLNSKTCNYLTTL